MQLFFNTKNLVIQNKNIVDANDISNIQGYCYTNDKTLNLPSQLSSNNYYGILFTQCVDSMYPDNPTWGYQIFYPISGDSSYHTLYVRTISDESQLSSSGWKQIQTDEMFLNFKEGIEDTLSEHIEEANDKISELLNFKETTENTLSEHIKEANDKFSELLNFKEGIEGTLSEHIEEANDKFSELESLGEISFDTFSIIDFNSDFTTAGTEITDSMASLGKAIQTTTTTSAKNLITANFSDVKFGKYALCLRLKVSSNTSSSSVFTANIINGSSTILSKSILGTYFDSTSNYCYICTTFDYSGSSSSAKQKLQLKLNTGTVSGLEVRFDYAYISLITPAVYI